MKDPGILFEDSDVLVLDKPAGLVVHADGRTEETTLVDWLIKKYPDIKNVGEPLALADGTNLLRPGIVHRLDRETSGALVVAKNQESYLFLKRQFQDREVKKKYHAFVYGDMKEERGTITKPIGRSPADFRRYSSTRGAKGEMRDAVTWFKVIAHKKGFSFVEAQPKTGRTHQIRVHFKAIGYPVVSDSLYAAKRAPALGFTRTALHARSLSFRLRGGKEVAVIAPYPKDFEEAMKDFGIGTKLAS